MFHFLLVANISGKVCLKNYDTSRLRVCFFGFLNGPLRCLYQGCRFKQIDLVNPKYVRRWQILTCEKLSPILKILG